MSLIKMKELPEQKILLLADVNSPHTQKWALELKLAGFAIGIFSLSYPTSDWFLQSGIIVFAPKSANGKIVFSKDILKIKYLASLWRLKKAIRKFKPDIIHAHYATSYGMLGGLTRFHPFFISVWGSDIIDFPNRSYFHKWILRKNLRKADKIFCTSEFLQKEVLRISEKVSVVIPFGVDINIFSPMKVRSLFNKNDIVIGAIKSLEKHYGIEQLIKVFAALYQKEYGSNLRLLIGGKGSQEAILKQLVDDLKLSHVVVFTGSLSYKDVPTYHNMIDIFVNLSTYESFGVSVLEASSCGKPVIATDTGGLREVVINNKTGFLVLLNDKHAIISAFEKLIFDSHLRKEMGDAGRQFVFEKFNWPMCLEKMSAEYKNV